MDSSGPESAYTHRLRSRRKGGRHPDGETAGRHRH